MITGEDLSFSKWTLYIFSELTLIPFEIEPGAGTVTPLREIGNSLWNCHFSLFVLQVAFKTLRLLQSVVLGTTNHPSFYVHLYTLLYSVLELLNGVQNCFRYKAEYAYLISALHCAKQMERNDARPKLRSLMNIWQHNFKEQCALCLPFTLMAAGFALIGVIYAGGDEPQYFYSIVPPPYKCIGAHLTLMVAEFYFLAVIVSLAYLCCYPLMHNVGHICEDILGKGFEWKMDEWERDSTQEGIQGLCQTLKEVQLEMKLFNVVFSTVAYVSKVLCLGAVSCSVFVGIRQLHQHNGTLAFMNIGQGFLCTIIYCMSFDDSYTIPEKVSDMKLRLLNICKKRRPGVFPYVSRLVRSVPKICVQSGSFYDLERQSTVLFLDFASKQIINLLLTIPE